MVAEWISECEMGFGSHIYNALYKSQIIILL